MYTDPLDASKLAQVFGFANRRGVNRAIRNGTLPVPTYSFNGKRFAHPEHVNKWLDGKKAEAVDEFGWMDEEEDDAS